jgi:hypothetical protein
MRINAQPDNPRPVRSRLPNRRSLSDHQKRIRFFIILFGMLAVFSVVALLLILNGPFHPAK